MLETRTVYIVYLETETMYSCIVALQKVHSTAPVARVLRIETIYITKSVLPLPYSAPLLFLLKALA